MKNSMRLTKKESSGDKTLKFRFLFLFLIACISAGCLFYYGFNLPLFIKQQICEFPFVARQMIFASLCSVGLLLFMPLLVRRAEFENTKKRLDSMEENQTTGYTDDVIKLSQQAVEMPVALPVAWDCLKEATNGLDIKALDKRRAAWLVDSVDDDRRTVRCSLQYIADPLGRKLSQIYPRTIEMVASVDGHGVNTRLRTRYSFATPMDLEAVSEIISKTNSRLNEIIVTADKSVRDQKEHNELSGSSNVAAMPKPSGYKFDELGSIDFPLSLN